MIVQSPLATGCPVIFYFMPNFDQNNSPLLQTNFQLYQTPQYYNFLSEKPPLNSALPSPPFLSPHQELQLECYQGHQRESRLAKQRKFLKRKEEQINLIIRNRNILPNNVNLVLSYMRRINKSGKTVSMIIQKLREQNQCFTTKKFYSYQQYLKNVITNDINRHELRNVSRFCDPSCSIFSQQEQIFYNKVFRIATYLYLKEDGILNILSSKKIYKTRRIDHLQSYRIIMKDVQRKNK